MRIKVSYSLMMMALASVAGGGTLAACAYSHEPVIATRCNESGDHCWQVQCNEDGEDCYPVGSGSGSSYDRGDSGYSRGDSGSDRRYWVCNGDGGNCHWAYGAPPESDR